ncbi:FAD-binding oxidoreductase [Paractinoplanes atraurantiacus]|uniref:FAD/FMN-containing dehydrogenase n=1 Tax=Paractinoplanes atraurantiacus TaxID=1036182 RepID=A0A285JRH2_9ACTN|nr:FAD-binding protein [Actinoplanes atraurantiacus]SNY62902.1 FAD/FMN-containing dehydrogenase [Actinoplanes atraurantiacus]
MVLPRFADIRPAAVLPCATAADVAAALATARRQRLPLAVRGGGHCFAGRSSTTGVLIDTTPMAGVRLDGHRAVIGAGTRLAEVYDRLAAHGRALPAGCGPTVGITGLTLGGGLGILGRQYGLTCDSLLAATMVRADGRTVEADDDLLWALRGGGAPGVVTSLTFATVPAPSRTAFRFGYPAAGAADLLDAWQHALPGLDEATAPSLTVTVAGESPRVTVFGAAPDDGAVVLLRRRLGQRPSADDRHHGSLPVVKRWLAGPESADPRFAHLHSEFFRTTVPAPELLERLTADRRPGEERELDFTPWGGAYNRPPAGATAFPHRDARFLLKQTATVRAGRRPGPWLDDSYALTHPYGTGGAYPNFPEPGLGAEAYYLANTDRLRRLHAAYDPEGVFRHETRPPGGGKVPPPGARNRGRRT